MSDINQVRQILMNELGLSRTSIREMARELIAEEVAKEVRTLVNNSTIERMVRDNFREMATARHHSRSQIEAFCEQAAKAAAEEFVRSRLVFSTNLEEA